MGEGEGDDPKANVDAYVIENNGIDLQRPEEESTYRSIRKYNIKRGFLIG